METPHSYTNRLIHQKSPYLLQHAHNPVDWYPWGTEAFEKAKREDKMVLVSIGYATCHWCHVMERESFEDPVLAEYLNQHFVAIKVDREERPDVDKIYMDALHALNEQGGWPLNMMITPEGVPVTGGTYFPPDNRYGRPSFRSFLEMVNNIWQNDRHRINEISKAIMEHLRGMAALTVPKFLHFDWSGEEQAFNMFKKTFDHKEGGFQMQPRNKFPPSMGLMLLLRYHQRTGEAFALEMVEKTLQKMFQGGIYDQLGGGLSRYSTDYQWLVPHFEKMLYDNALFVWVLIETFQVTKNSFYRDAAKDVLNYVERDMRSPQGGFYSAEDADSEGEEGKFYVWKEEEILEILGLELGRQAIAYWGISKHGNFEHGTNILHCPNSLEQVAQQFDLSPESFGQNIEEARQKLLAIRTKRIRPLCDDKILSSWNGLMISAFARAARVFAEPRYGEIAATAAQFVFSELVDENERLLRRYRDGESDYLAYLCDYAQLATACLDLYEFSYDLRWFEKAVGLIKQVNVLFRNETGPYFDTGVDAEKLIARNMEGYDGVEPSGNSALALLFLKLEAYGLSSSYFADAERILGGFHQHLIKAGLSFAAMHWALHFMLSGPKQVVVVGKRGDPETESLLQVVRQEFYPNIVTVFVPVSDVSTVAATIPVAAHREAINGQATAYVCQNQVCQLPIHTPDTLREQLNQKIVT